MKKGLSLFLCILMIFSLCSTVVFAAGTPTISVSNGSCNPGETVDLDVSFANNPGIASMTITPTMPTDSGFTWKAESYNGAFGALTVGLNCQFNNSGVDYTQDGKFLTLKVTVPEGTEPGEYPITFKYRTGGNASGGRVKGVACVAGTLTVLGASEPTVALTLSAVGDGHVAYGSDSITTSSTYSDVVPGTLVSLNAVSDGGDFLYWKDNTNGKLYSELANIEFNAVEDISLTAVFKDTAAATRMVTYKNSNGAILKAEEVAEGAALAAPATNPTAYGYTFKGWSLTEDEIAATAGDVVVVALYDRADVYFTINVTGGSVVKGVFGKDENAGKNVQLSQAFLKANDAEAGYKFAYWKNADTDAILNYNAEYDFYVTSNLNVEAVFVAAETTVAPATVINVSFTAADAVNNKVSFTSERFVPAGLTVASHGIILTSDAGVGADANAFVIGGANVLKGTASTTRPAGKYTLTKKEAGSANWYARGYVITVDAEGTVTVTYSAIASGSIN